MHAYFKVSHLLLLHTKYTVPNFVGNSKINSIENVKSAHPYTYHAAKHVCVYVLSYGKPISVLT